MDGERKSAIAEAAAAVGTIAAIAFVTVTKPELVAGFFAGWFAFRYRREIAEIARRTWKRTSGRKRA